MDTVGTHKVRGWLGTAWRASRGDPAATITLAASAIFGLLAVTGAVKSTAGLAGATLGTLALVAFSFLVEGSRRRAAEQQALQQSETTKEVVREVASQLGAVSQAVTRLSTFRVYRQETPEAKRHQLRLIRECRPSKVKMWEHSASTARYLIDELGTCEHPVRVQLLVAHPATLSSWHRSRARQTIDDIRMNLPDWPNLDVEIKCYEKPSIRGRSFDDRFVAIGWYTFDRRARVQMPADAPPILGAHNAVVIADCATLDGIALRDSFNECFDGIWTTAPTYDEAVAAHDGAEVPANAT